MKQTYHLKTSLSLALLLMSGAFFAPSQLLAVSLPLPTSTFEHAESTPALFERFIEEDVFPVSDDRDPKRTMIVVATAYSSDPWQTDSSPCTPAMWTFHMCEEYERFGTDNTIAANFLPLGVQVKFPELFGDKIFVVRDRMNARYNGTRRIDFWIASGTPRDQEIIREAKIKAVAFGVKRVKMEVF